MEPELGLVIGHVLDVACGQAAYAVCVAVLCVLQCAPYHLAFASTGVCAANYFLPCVLRCSYRNGGCAGTVW